MSRGLFVGLTTLDCIYHSDRYPQANQKVVAQDYLTVAGGPATNAAVAFSYFGDRPRLLTVLGKHPICELIKNDLTNYGVEIIDLIPHKSETPPLSSVIVTTGTGERGVISINATKSSAQRAQLPEQILDDIEIILIDGHQLDVSQGIIELANKYQIPKVLDGGSWKPGLETILPGIDYAICSANFLPPQCHDQAEVFTYLQDWGITQIAITQGEQPIKYLHDGNFSTIAIPQIRAVDTLGAGDIFHGAFCHYILHTDFPQALEEAAKIASQSCQFFGTRSWLRDQETGRTA